jgi:t-SNARE complex subunit (syntaxin)
MASYSARTSNLDTVTAQVQDVKLQMQKNVELVMNRGENLDNLERRTERLQDSGNMFQKSSKQVKSMFQCKNMKWTIFLIVFVSILLFLIGLAIYLNVKN